MREMQGVHGIMVMGQEAAQMAGVGRGRSLREGVFTQGTQKSTSALREVTATQMKPFLYSVHGTIHPVS